MRKYWYSMRIVYLSRTSGSVLKGEHLKDRFEKKDFMIISPQSWRPKLMRWNETKPPEKDTTGILTVYTNTGVLEQVNIIYE